MNEVRLKTLGAQHRIAGRIFRTVAGGGRASRRSKYYSGSEWFFEIYSDSIDPRTIRSGPKLEEILSQYVCQVKILANVAVASKSVIFQLQMD